MTRMEKLTIAQGICGPLLRKIRGDLQRNIETEESESDCVNRLNPRYSSGVSSPGRHVRTRLYFTSESHIHSLLTIIAEVGLVDVSIVNSGIRGSRLLKDSICPFSKTRMISGSAPWSTCPACPS